MKKIIKYLLFKTSLISDDGLIIFFANSRYKVIFDGDDYYVLENQNGQKCGIGKECDGEKYDIIEIEVNNE